MKRFNGSAMLALGVSSAVLLGAGPARADPTVSRYGGEVKRDWDRSTRIIRGADGTAWDIRLAPAAPPPGVPPATARPLPLTVSSPIMDSYHWTGSSTAIYRAGGVPFAGNAVINDSRRTQELDQANLARSFDAPGGFSPSPLYPNGVFIIGTPSINIAGGGVDAGIAESGLEGNIDSWRTQTGLETMQLNMNVVSDVTFDRPASQAGQPAFVVFTYDLIDVDIAVGGASGTPQFVYTSMVFESAQLGVLASSLLIFRNGDATPIISGDIPAGAFEVDSMGSGNARINLHYTLTFEVPAGLDTVSLRATLAEGLVVPSPGAAWIAALGLTAIGGRRRPSTGRPERPGTDGVASNAEN